MHWSFTDTNQNVTVNLAEHSSDGKVWGTVAFGGQTYSVNGLWEASGAVAGRNTSVLHLAGQGSAPGEFIAISGHIAGTAPSMTGIDLTVSAASGSNGTLAQSSANLTQPLVSDAPSETSPPTGAQPGSAWLLSSLDGKATMDVQAGSDGVIVGNLTVNGTQYSCNGWRNGSAFEVLGTHDVAPSVSDLLGAVGIVGGDWQWPDQVQVSGSAASISNDSNPSFSNTLLPMYRQDAGLLNAAYAESYVVIQIPHGEDGQVQGWIGPTDANGQVSPFGSADYQAAGTALSAAQLAEIMQPDPDHPGTNDIRIPPFESAAGTRPVMVQFIGEVGHFPQPPLEEAHEHIGKLFYDDAAGALVLQFADQPAGARTTVINFNAGRGRNHNSVIIEPR